MASEHLIARHVLAVVACWGRVVAGTRGLRAQFSRVEALWVSDAVPEPLAREVSSRYPSATVYRDQAAMLAYHRLTELDCYEPPRGVPAFWPHRWVRAAMACAVVLGLLPAGVVWGIQDARWVWGIVFGCFVIAACATGRSPHDPAGRRHRLLYIAVALWMVAPFAGAGGVIFLRLPLIQVAALTVRQRLAESRMARRFPADIR